MKDTLLDSFTVVFYHSTANKVQSFDLAGETTNFGSYTTIRQSSDRDYNYNTVGETIAVALYRTNNQEKIKHKKSK